MKIEFETTLDRDEGEIEISIVAVVGNYAETVDRRLPYGSPGSGCLYADISSVLPSVDLTKREQESLIDLAIEEYHKNLND